MVIVTETFCKHSPAQFRKRVLEEVSCFRQNIMRVQGLLGKLPKGSWIKRIRNTDIFKFRLNNSDRILFTTLEPRPDEPVPL